MTLTMSLDQLIAELQEIRSEHGGTLRVLVRDDDKPEGDAPVIHCVRRQDGERVVAIL